MNRTFKILWFEDELPWYNMEQRRVTDILAMHCLLPQITRRNGDDFDLTEVCTNCYDLIIMDFKLAAGTTGDTIVSAIRGNNVLTDILFYSSEEENMINAINSVSPPIDGIYYTKRNYEVFTEKAKGLISKIVWRSEDLVNLRGFVLDDSCDFEVRVRDILINAWQKFNEQEKEALEGATHKAIATIEDRQTKSKKKILGQSPIFIAAMNDKHFLSHSDCLYLLTKVIPILQSSYSFTPKPEHNNFKVQYEDNISRYRNAFGHKKSSENAIEITRGQLIPIDSSLHQKMRTTLSQYDDLIHDLESCIAAI